MRVNNGRANLMYYYAVSNDIIAVLFNELHRLCPFQMYQTFSETQDNLNSRKFGTLSMLSMNYFFSGLSRPREVARSGYAYRFRFSFAFFWLISTLFLFDHQNI